MVNASKLGTGELVDPGAAVEEDPSEGAAAEVEGEVNPALLAFLPVSLGDVAIFSALKKSFLSIYGFDLPVPRGSRSVKSPATVLDVIPVLLSGLTVVMGT